MLAMETIWIYSLLSVLVVSVASLVGVFTLSLSENRLRSIVFALVALSVGALFGDVFIHIIPEVFEDSGSKELSSLYILFGIVAFFVLEKFLHWQHRHGCDDPGCHQHGPRPLGKIILISDGIHNFIDGIIIGVAYLVSLPLGIATTIAVVLHEIPQELGNFGILIHSGYSRGKALLFNFFSALVAFLGVLVPLLIGSRAIGLTSVVLPIAAGGFIYIAGSDLIPELHNKSQVGRAFSQLIFIIIGIVLMYLLLFLE